MVLWFGEFGQSGWRQCTLVCALDLSILIFFFSHPPGVLELFATYCWQITRSQQLPCVSLTLPVPQVSTLCVLETSLLTAIAIALAWFKYYVVQKIKPLEEKQSHVPVWLAGCMFGTLLGHQQSFCHLALASTPQHSIGGKRAACVLPKRAVPAVCFDNKKICISYLFVFELKEFLLISPTSLLAYLWLEIQWSMAQLLMKEQNCFKERTAQQQYLLPSLWQQGNWRELWFSESESSHRQLRGTAALSCCLTRSTEWGHDMVQYAQAEEQ